VRCVSFAQDRTRFSPCETLTLNIDGKALVTDEVVSAELSVLWETSGKGDTDSGVAFVTKLSCSLSGAPESVTVELPEEPCSYEGPTLKIQWLVRVRMKQSDGLETVEETMFRVGQVGEAEP
jgi:hypothetical protein